MPRPAPIPERSAVSIMEESQEASLLAGSRASVAVSTAAAVSTAVEGGEGKFGSTKTNENDDTEKEHAHKEYDA